MNQLKLIYIYIYFKDDQLAGYKDPQVGLFFYKISNISNFTR